MQSVQNSSSLEHLTLNTAVSGGAREDRTPDLLRARQALSQLSYGPLMLRNFEFLIMNFELAVRLRRIF